MANIAQEVKQETAKAQAPSNGEALKQAASIESEIDALIKDLANKPFASTEVANGEPMTLDAFHYHQADRITGLRHKYNRFATDSTALLRKPKGQKDSLNRTQVLYAALALGLKAMERAESYAIDRVAGPCFEALTSAWVEAVRRGTMKPEVFAAKISVAQKHFGVNPTDSAVGALQSRF